MKNIMFIAPPAAGKGTQAEIIESKYNIPHISTGDILRDIAEEESELGEYVSEVLSSGELVKDEITDQLIENTIGEGKTAFPPLSSLHRRPKWKKNIPKTK